MNRPQRQLDVLVPLLLVVTMSELALNRLAVPALRLPAAGELGSPPPLWHQAFDYSALFLHYFASTLALATIALLIAAVAGDRDSYSRTTGALTAMLGAAFALIAAVAILRAPGEALTFWFETAYAALLLVIALTQLRRGGSLAIKLGIFLLVIPLALHYYGPLASRTAAGREALWLGRPEQILALGQWAVVAVGLASPYLLSPRPAARALAQPFPLIVALLVAAASGLLLYTSYEVAMIVAARGVGLDLGPGAPASQLGLYVLALASLVWTTISCLVAPAPARRRLGAGLALVIAGGYALTWPLHYLASAIGLLVVADAGRRVARQERSLLADERARAAAVALTKA